MYIEYKRAVLWCLLCRIVCSILLRHALLCYKRHSRILYLFFLLHISDCHLKIYGFAHFFSLPLGVLFEGKLQYFFRYFLTNFAFFICFNCCWRFLVSLIFTLFSQVFFLSCLVFVPFTLSQVLL